MSDSPIPPPHDAFDQIADVFLTDPPEKSESRACYYDTGETAGTLIESSGSTADDSIGINTWTAPPLSLAGGPIELTPIDDCAPESSPQSGPGIGDEFSSAASSPHETSAEDGEEFNPRFSETLPSHTSMLLACHLPVQGRLWLNQIADLVARTHGPTCFIRIDSEKMVAAELLAMPDEESVPELHQSGRSLAEAIRQIAPQIRHYFIHVEQLAEIEAITAAHEPAPARIILATSIDPAALVGVYRTLKDLVPILHADTEIELILVGTAPEAAKAAFGRISSATTGFLKRAVVLHGIIQRIKPIVMTHLGDFEHPGGTVQTAGESAESLVAWVCNEIGASHDAVASAVPTSTFAPSAPIAPQPSEPIIATPPPAVTTIPVPIPIPTPFEITPPVPPTPIPSSAPEPIPAPVAPVETRPNLSGLIAGLTDLIARSPKGLKVELAVDTSGGVHALYQDSADENPHDAIAQLQRVCEWIEKNAEMITLLRTYPVAAESADGPSQLPSPQAHLFTDHPQKYRTLMDGSLRIHLLARNCDVVVKSSEKADLFEQDQAADPSWIQVPIN